MHQDVNRPIKIAFDAKRIFHNGEGLGSYARTLVSSMQEYLPEYAYFLCTPTLSKHQYAKAFLDEKKYSHILAPPSANQAYWRSRGILRQLKEKDIDIYWGLSNELPIGITESGCQSIVTIHDLFYKKYPRQFKWVDRVILGRKYRSSIQSASKILVPSISTQKDLLMYFPKAKNRVEVVYQSTQYEGRVPEVLRDMEPYYLMVGSITPRKNLDLVVNTYAELEPEHRLKVKVVGRETRYADKLRTRINQHGVSDYFDFMGQVSDSELWTLYSGARALLFPSRYEGFGIPIIEALSAGVPVIGNSRSSIPEVVGKHGIVIEYDSTESLKAAFLKMKDDSIHRGLLKDVERHLYSFSKERVIKVVKKVLNDLIGQN